MATALKLQASPIQGQERVQSVKEHLSRHLRGKTEIVDLSLATFLAGGHLLLEGPPGTGKTSLAKAMASAFGGTFRRLQMTSDLLPSDIVGILRLRAGQSEFEFRKGPLFSNFLLADELNRTSPKTQSALLEAMAEGTVTVDGRTYELPDPFFVVATQNPAEFQGVYPLAESQLDRFMMQLMLTSPDKEVEREIYRKGSTGSGARTAEEPAGALITDAQTRCLRLDVRKVHVEETVLAYCTELVHATRERNDVLHGVSIRGGLQLLAAAQGLAYVRGRDFVTPADVAELAVPVLAHRLSFIQEDPEPSRRQEVIHEILEQVPAPK